MSAILPCPKCGAYNELDDSKCWKCKREITEEEKLLAQEKADKARVEKELYKGLSENEKDRVMINKARELGNWSMVSDDALNRAAEEIILTTSFQLASREIASEVAIVTAEVVYGMNFFRDLFAGVRDLVGGRSDATQKVLKDSRNTVLLELKKEALKIGAEAVIAVDLDYQELSGGGKGGMIMLIASGTAVKLKI